jgi:predicted Ser/Thr protein kinase
VTDPPHSARHDWATVNDLFHRALGLPADRRSAFLDAECAGNAALRDEVLSLLAAHDRAGDFMEAPPPDVARSRVGSMIGHYRIDDVLGEGGMGVVYLASDTRLGRAVAVKALAPRFTGDPGRRERLRREARAAAQLSHPAIATVYSLEEFDDHLYVVSEYVAGETLRSELARGPVPFDRVIETALEIAGGLAAAHERGIVHRDLKPENVVRAPDGRVKILDFGLARFRDLQASNTQLTDDGMILGTPGYMAPEQIRGQPVDFRADIFAFGVLLFELTTATHPFPGADPASTIAKILEAPPADLESRRPAGAAPVEWEAFVDVVLRALEKAPSNRFTSTPELVRSLRDVRETPVARLHGSGARRRVETPTLRWWIFHQAAVTAAYAALVRVLMYVLLAERQSPSDFLLLSIGVVAVLVASTLRLHLWFTHRWYPAEWRTQHRRVSPWIKVADLIFVAVLLATASLGFQAHRHLALLLIASAAASFLASLVIEPATTKAAFGDGG